MKRFFPCILALMLVWMLTGCAGNPLKETTAYNETTIDGKAAAVIFDEGTLEAGYVAIGKDSYRFTYSGLTSLKLTLTYPDGSVYHVSGSGAVDAELQNHDADDPNFPDPLTLCSAIEEGVYLQSSTAAENRGPSLLLGIILLAAGLWHLLYPKNAWKICQGWLFHGETPTSTTLLVFRICGAGAIAAGVIVTLLAVIRLQG